MNEISSNNLPLTSFTGMITITLVFLVVVISLKWILKNFPNIQKYESFIVKIISFNNTLYGILSGIYCISFLLFHQKPNSNDQLIYLYYLSKIYEFLDIVLVILLNHSRNRDDDGLSAHFAIHHITTLSVVWACFYSPSSILLQDDRLMNRKTLLGEIHLAPIVTNTFHHFLMYIHLGGFIKIFGRLLPWSGALQLVVGVFAVCSQLFEKIFMYGKWNIQSEVYVCVMYAIYLTCHIRDLKTKPKQI